MSAVQSTPASAPEVPHEPIRSGIFAAWLARRITSRSRFTACRLTLDTARNRYDGPLSVEPASHAIASTPRALARSTSTPLIPAPRAPTGTRMLVRLAVERSVILVSEGDAKFRAIRSVAMAADDAAIVAGRSPVANQV